MEGKYVDGIKITPELLHLVQIFFLVPGSVGEYNGHWDNENSVVRLQHRTTSREPVGMDLNGKTITVMAWGQG